jgi:hypothetical protein
MAIEALTLKDLRQTALAYVGESDSQNHFGSRMNLWVNEGLRKMYAGITGVEEEYTTTCVPGQRMYPVPAGFLFDKMLMIDNYQLEFRTTNDLDYYAAGNSRPLWYTLWGKPNTKIYLGPQSPDSTYNFHLFYYRTPAKMVADTDEPELPAQWRTALSKWAAAQAMLADGDTTQAQALLQDFIEERANFQAWFTDESRNNYLSVQYSAEY